MSFQQQIDEAIKEGALYFVGDALPPDWYAGFKQWLPLAEGGDAKAAFNVGTCYLRGDGVDRSSTTALDWYRRAANIGDTRAMLALYEQMRARTPSEAEEWLQRAIAAGDERALKTLNQRQADAERSAREADAKERARTLAARSSASLKEIKALLERRDLAGARQRAETAVQDGVTWAGAVIAALSLRVHARKRVRKEYTVLKGSATTLQVVQGVYQTTANTSSTKYHDVRGEATNPSRYTVNVSFGGGSGFGLLAAGGTMPIYAERLGSVRAWGKSFSVLLDDQAHTVLTIPTAPGQISFRPDISLSWGLGGSSLKASTLRWGGVILAVWFLHKVWWLWTMWQITHH